MTRPTVKIAIILMLASLLASCSTPLFSTPTPTATATVLPTNTPLPTVTPTATPVPYFVSATVLSGNIQAPIILYHRFRESHDNDSVWVKLSTFKEQLQKLYDAGYSLVSLPSWINGTFTVPAGRKPLVFTMDDGVFADQLYISDDGTPAENTAIGILWRFSKDHPDFGFSAAIFCDVGDKYYGDIAAGDWFYVSEGNAWKKKLGQAIAWALENGVEIYSHTYQHVDLSKTTTSDILLQLQMEDNSVRDFLYLAGRQDLNVKLGNMIALPFGIWPATDAGKNVLLQYKNPEGRPVTAIFEAYNATDARFTPSYFASDFDPMALPRTTATNYSIDWVITNKDSVPTAAECKLGPTDESANGDAAKIQALISAAIQSGACPEGVYNVGGLIFVAKDGTVSQYSPEN
jgi:hypothetical protein